MNLFFAMFALFCGEAFAIYAELIAAKGHPFIGMIYKIPSLPLLILGYWAGYKAAGNIWQVTAVSVCSILIVEPLLIILMFREVPERNALIGCLCGFAGIIIASIKSG